MRIFLKQKINTNSFLYKKVSYPQNKTSSEALSRVGNPPREIHGENQ
jgi:hypothetical protein